MPSYYDPSPLEDPRAYRASGGTPILNLIMENGRIGAARAERSADIWGHAAQDISRQLGAGIMSAAQSGEDAKVGNAILAARSPYPSATKPQGWTPEDGEGEGQGRDHMADILASVSPELRPRIIKGLADADLADAALAAKKAEIKKAGIATKKDEMELAQTIRDQVGTYAHHVLGMKDAPDGGLHSAAYAIPRLEAQGVKVPEDFKQQIQDGLEVWEQTGAQDPRAAAIIADTWRKTSSPFLESIVSGMSPDALKKLQDAQPKTREMVTRDATGAENKQIVPDVAGPTIYRSEPDPAKVGSFDDYVIKKYGRQATPEQIAEARKVYGQADDRARITVTGGMNGLYGGIDPKAIAEAIKRGEQPPSITDLGRPVGAAVSSELAKQGFNLAAAATDWKATQKHVASLNGTQQLRLNQAVNALPDLLDTVDTLAGQWKGGRFPALNKANLALAKGGAYGSDVAAIATQLEAQIADVNADLAVVYMGGNSPTDHGLSLASKALSGDWDEKVLKSMVKTAKQNVIIRRNSILNTGVAGASGGNPYAGGPGYGAPVAGGGAPAALPEPKSAAEMAALPRGSQFKAPDGSIRTVP